MSMFVKLRSGEVRMILRTGNIMDLAGVLHDPDRPTPTIDEMNGAAEGGMRGIIRYLEEP